MRHILNLTSWAGHMIRNERTPLPGGLAGPLMVSSEVCSANPHFSHALRRLHHRKRFHCLIKLTWRMASNLPDFERTFPPPPVGEVGGEVCGLAVSGSWGSGAGAAQQGMRQGKLMLIRAGRGDSDMDPAHADLYQSADLQQFQPDAAATGPGELGEGQADAA